MYGNFTRVAIEPARAARESPSFAGSGMSMECIERNPVLFAMLADTVWTDQPLDIADWLATYLKSRYRFVLPEVFPNPWLSFCSDFLFSPQLLSSHVLPAWLLLNSSVYHFNGQLVHAPLEERPKFSDGRLWIPPS